MDPDDPNYRSASAQERIERDDPEYRAGSTRTRYYSDDPDYRYRRAADAAYAVPGADFAAVRRVSWGAIFAGAITAIVTLMLLNLLGAGIGMSSIDPSAGERPLQGLGTAAIIWWVASNIVALFAGGFVAGRLSGFPTGGTTMLHGFLSWGVYTLVSIWLLTSAIGSIVSGAGSVLSSTLTMARTVEDVAPGVARDVRQEIRDANISFEDIRSEVRQLFADTPDAEDQAEELTGQARRVEDQTAADTDDQAMNAQALEQDVENYLQNTKSQGREMLTPQDKQALTNIVQNRTNLSQAEARSAVDRWATQYQQTVASARPTAVESDQPGMQVTEQDADAMGTAAIIAFFALLIGAAAAVAGGAMGRNRDLVVAGATAAYPVRDRKLNH